MPRVSPFHGSRVVALLAALAVFALGSLTIGVPSASAAAAWGNTGATYDGGIVCELPGAVRVPLVAWSVDGRRAFAGADVSEVNGDYGPAPVSGASVPTGGAGGFVYSGADAAAIAYLIEHHGAGSAVEVAETSAVVAALAGRGPLQQRCLGQQGTNRQHAADLLDQARRYAGPYQVSVAPVRSPRAGVTTTVSAQVRSATGSAVPDVRVEFGLDTQQAFATTGADGTATADLTAPQHASTPLSASIAEPTGLTYPGTDPATVAPGPATTYTGASSLVVEHPQPTVRVDTSAGLLLASGTLTPSAVVGGTLGYPGTGEIDLHGPLDGNLSVPCSSLDVADLTAAPTVWTGRFSIDDDGTYQAGRTPALAAGCYAASASVTLPSATPAATARSSDGAGSVVVVSGLQLSESAGSGLARPGRLHATVTGTTPGGARVDADVVTYGPVLTPDGTCDHVSWAGAQASSAGPTTALTAAPDDRLTARLATTPVGRPGCYALAARTTVTLDGHQLRVDTPIGEKGTTALVLRPVLSLTDRTTDGQQGERMTGTLHVSGVYDHAADVAIALRSAAPTIAGCRGVTFPTSPGGTPTSSLHITGDGDYRYRTPIATRNRCYAVVATLAMSADRHVTFGPSAPAGAATFLAGIPLDDGVGPGVPRAAAGVPRRAVVVLAIGMLAALLIAGMTIVGGYVSSGTDGYRPSFERLAELL